MGTEFAHAFAALALAVALGWGVAQVLSRTRADSVLRPIALAIFTLAIAIAAVLLANALR